MMKKMLLFLVLAVSLASCSMEDDGPNYARVEIPVSEIDLPEFFELGKTYEIKVNYILPDECHNPAGVVAFNNTNSTEYGRTDVFVIGLASVKVGDTSCDPEPAALAQEEEEENPLEHTGTFTITIDDEDAYTFYLWKGVDEEDENIFEEVVVPVGEENIPQPEK